MRSRRSAAKAAMELWPMGQSWEDQRRTGNFPSNSYSRQHLLIP